MKFAKYLESEAVPEWKKKYIAYKTLKKVIKSVARASEGTVIGPDAGADAGAWVREATVSVSFSRDGTVLVSPSAPAVLDGAPAATRPRPTGDKREVLDVLDVACFTELIPQLPAAQGRFQLILAAEARKINQFYFMREEEAAANLARIKELFSSLMAAEAPTTVSPPESARPQEEPHSAEMVRRRASSLGSSVSSSSSGGARSRPGSPPGPGRNTEPGSDLFRARLRPRPEPFRGGESGGESPTEDLVGLHEHPDETGLGDAECVEMDLATAGHVEEILQLERQSTRRSGTATASKLDRLSISVPGSRPPTPTLPPESSAKTPRQARRPLERLRHLVTHPLQPATPSPQAVAAKDAEILKRALQELYRTLELLKNYRILNYTGFVKIVKKFDKAVHTSLLEPLKGRMARLYFNASPLLDEMLAAIENMYALLVGGRRNAALSDLHVPQPASFEGHVVVWRSGVCMGVAAALLVAGLVRWFETGGASGRSEVDSHVMELFTAFAIPVLFGYLFALNLHVYRRCRINYVFIFELSPRQHISMFELFDLVAAVSLLFSATFFLAFHNVLNAFVSVGAYPMIFFVLAIVMLVNPLPLLYRDSRFWLLVSLYRLVTAGLHSIEFRDFFTGDEVNSMSYVLGRMYLLGCVYATGYGPTCANASWGASVLSALPAYWRAVQCMRRFIDGRWHRISLVNFGKYCTSILGTLVFGAWRLYPAQSAVWTPIFVASAVIATVYNTAWDLYHDWGLLRNHPEWWCRLVALVFSGNSPFPGRVDADDAPSSRDPDDRSRPLSSLGASQPRDGMPSSAGMGEQTHVVRGVTVDSLHSLVTTNHDQLYPGSSNNLSFRGPAAANSEDPASAQDPVDSAGSERYKAVFAPRPLAARARWAIAKTRAKLNTHRYFLRDDLAYPSIWIYYACMLLDIAMRLQWLLPLFLYRESLGSFSLFLMALIEIFRRFMWNFFRMENEHLNNCGRFRAVREIPLLLNAWSTPRLSRQPGHSRASSRPRAPSGDAIELSPVSRSSR